MIKEMNGKFMRGTVQDPKARIKSSNPMGCEYETNRISNKAAENTDWGDTFGKQWPCLVQWNASIHSSMHSHSWICIELSGVGHGRECP